MYENNKFPLWFLCKTAISAGLLIYRKKYFGKIHKNFRKYWTFLKRCVIMKRNEMKS